jgi:hypothetical protein
MWGYFDMYSVDYKIIRDKLMHIYSQTTPKYLKLSYRVMTQQYYKKT